VGLSDLLTFEKQLLDKGINLIAGVDEVGRGPLAGPFVAAAVILDLKKLINDVTSQKISDYKLIRDSKKVMPKERVRLAEFIRKEAISYSIIEIPVEEVDELGISKTTQKAFYNSIQQLNIKPEHILTDSFEIKKLAKQSQTNLANGDGVSISIAAASIIAKVYRDNIMINMHKIYPNYGFDRHKGYGTKLHFEALQAYGPCEIHRKSFAPVKQVLINLNS